MSLLSSEISTKKMVTLCRQMSTVYDAGIPIVQGLNVIKNNMKDREVQQVLTKMQDDLRQGATLAEAAEAQQSKLPRFFIQLIATGEHGGQLDVMLQDLANYFEDQLELRRQVIRAMTYPSIQLAFAWYAGTFALGLIGKLGALFQGRGQSDFGLMTYFREYGVFQMRAGLVFATLVVAAVILSRLGIFQWIQYGAATFIWPMSNVTRKFALARFFRSMALLVSSGLSMPQCIRGSAAVAVNPYVQKDLLKAVPYVKQGSTLTEAFSHSRMLSPMAREMVFVGEQSGNLEYQLKKISKYHQEEADHAVAIATRVANVLIIVLVAGLVGYIVISFYAAYFGILGDLLNG